MATKVQIPISQPTTIFGEFRDALYFDAGHVPPQAEIDAMAAERIAAWLAAMQASVGNEVAIVADEEAADGI